MDRNSIEVHFQNLKTLHLSICGQCTFIRKMVSDILDSNRQIEQIHLISDQQLKTKPLLNIIKSNSSIWGLLLEHGQYESVVSSLDVQRFVSEHPSMDNLCLCNYKLTAENAIAMIRQLKLLKRFIFKIDDLSEYDDFVSQLMDSDWESRNWNRTVEIKRKSL